MHKILYALLLLSNLSLFSQELEELIYLDSYSRDELSLLAGISVYYGVDLYKVRYTTPDLQGQSHIASGLLCLPQAAHTRFPLACYQHGTVGSREDVPSNLRGGYQLPMVLAAFGYVTCAPDYIGLGDSPGIHPYVHARTEASAAVDMLFAVRTLAEENPNVNINDQLFITGYSQGGHAAMALQRMIETEIDDFSVTASAPMSGPYSISEEMVEFTLGGEEYGTVAYLGWLVLSYQAAYPELLAEYALEDIFKAEYIDDIEAFREEDITLWELNDRLSAALLVRAGAVVPRALLHDSIAEAIISNPSHPLSMALADNDTYDWAPQAPTRLYYCEGDEQITYKNALKAASVMQANGAYDVEAVRRDEFTLLGHGQCIFPASFSGILFFMTHQEISTPVIELAQSDVRLYFAEGLLIVDTGPVGREMLRLDIYNTAGAICFTAPVYEGVHQFDLSHLTAGMYYVQLHNHHNLLRTAKVTITR